jgi:hypothetical protein
MNVNPILNFLEKLVQEKLDLTASLKVVGVLVLVAISLWVVNVVVHARANSGEGRVK